MPANPKYLTLSPWKRFAKISAAIVGGYVLTTCFHLALALWLDPVTVLITSAYSSFLLWVGLMVVAFLARNGWKVWGYYLLLSAFFGVLIVLGQGSNPITS
jgi:hypothetical protein